MNIQQSDSKAEEWIALIFDAVLTIAPIQGEPSGDLLVNAVKYKDCQYGALTTFYDRIVDDNNRFVGIQLWPAISSVEPFFDRLSSLQYVYKPRDERCIEIYWHDRPEYGTRSTAEQAFGGPIYQSDQGVLCLTIDFQFLSGDPIDRTALMSANANFGEASVIR